MKRDPLAVLQERFQKKQLAAAMKVLRGKKTEPLEFSRALAKAKKLQTSLNRKKSSGKKAKSGKRSKR